MSPLRRALLAAAAALFAMPVFAQSIDTKIFFTGADPYTEKDLTSVLGLHAGQLFSDNEVQAASQRLVDTGLFDSVAMTATGTGRARQIRFTIKVTPDDKLLKPSFANFVWLTPEELDLGLRSHVPLYRGLLPDSGNLADSLSDALTAMLKEKGVNATVAHAIIEPTTEHPGRVVNFAIDQPAIVISAANIKVATLDAADATALAPQLRPGTPYNDGLAGETVEDLLLKRARDAGYVDAQLTGLEHQVSGNSVTLTGTLVSGSQYRLSALHWTATPLYSESDLKRDSALHFGEVATGVALFKTEDAILNAYRAQGYIDAYLRVHHSFDNTLRTVDFDMSVMPGEPYHLHAVMLIGPNPQTAHAFHDSWKMQAGDLYSPVYVVNYLKTHAAQPEFGAGLMSYLASANPDTHLVDLTITFVPNPHSR